MPVANLKYLPRPDCFNAQIGGPPKGSHAYDYESFGVALTYHGVCIGISPGQYRHLVAEDLEKHVSEFEGIADGDGYWDTAIREIMMNNVATFYIAKRIVNSLRRIAKPAFAELRPAQPRPSIYNNNHCVILGKQKVSCELANLSSLPMREFKLGRSMSIGA
jgi:hypothetical protein